MGLETATYINGLVPTNPDGTDIKSQGDDHFRLIKSVLKNSFPNITGAVTATQDDINKTAVVGNFCFPGMIVMWSGSVGSIPSGWKLCNGVGTISTGSAVPDLRARFIFGTDGTTGGAVGTIGGTNNLVINGSTLGHALTIAEMPSHTHELLTNDSVGADFGSNPDAIFNTPTFPVGFTQPTGGNQSHSHGISITVPFGNMPAFMSLAYLIKN